MATPLNSFYRIFLDDERMPKDVTWMTIPLGPWYIVRNYEAFIKAIQEKGLPDHISFDHDLGLEHYTTATTPVTKEAFAQMIAGTHGLNYGEIKTKTGYHAAQWLVSYCLDGKLKLPSYTIHSMNPVGAENIRKLLEGFAKSQGEEGQK